MAYAHVNGVDLYYEIKGQGDPLLLLPGLGSDAGTWAAFLPAASQYQSITLENRGCARSSKPPDGYSMELMADDAVAVLDQLGIDRVHVLGKSMGGMIAQHIAANHPGRVRSLVLASTVVKHDSYGQEVLELGRAVAEKVGLDAIFRLAFLMSHSREYCIKNRTRLAEAEALLKKIGSQELLRGYLAQSIACQQHDATQVLKNIQAPTLVIVGKEDTITPPEASREVADGIPGAELVVFEKGGHGFWREFPEEVNRLVLDFLTRH